MEELSKRLNKMIEFSLGCTEPAAIAYNTATLSKHIKNTNKIEIEIDRMTFKNAFAAGIPKTNGLTGTKNAAILGFLIKDDSKGLQIFDLIDENILNKLNKSTIQIDIYLSDKKYLYIHSKASHGDDTFEVITRKTHLDITDIIKNGKHIFKKKVQHQDEEIEFEDKYFDKRLWKGIVEKLYCDKELVDRVEKAIETNLKAIEYSRKYLDPGTNPAFGAIYARMGGDSIEIASCAGSGNKGIAAIGSLAYIAKKRGYKGSEITKAVILSCLITSLITSKFGFVSSECGVVHAAGVGVMAGLLYLENNLDLFYAAYKNYIEGVGGVFCDGAKRGCSMKGYVSIKTAIDSIELAKNNLEPSNTDGFLGKNLKETVYNLMLYDPYFKLFDRETVEILMRKS